LNANRLPNDGTRARDLTVLVADDEPEVLEVVVEFLRLKGFQTIQAKDGAEALRLAGEFPDPIHLLVTDVQMPGMNGRELAERLRLQRPAIKVLFMSGYTCDELSLQGVRDAEVALLLKPFSSSELIGKMRESFPSLNLPEPTSQK